MIVIVLIVLVVLYFSTVIGLLMQTYQVEALERIRGYVWIIPFMHIFVLFSFLFQKEFNIKPKTVRKLLSINSCTILIMRCLAENMPPHDTETDDLHAREPNYILNSFNSLPRLVAHCIA